MQEIKLTKGYVTLVDDEDYEYLSQWLWYVSDNKNGYHYAARAVPCEGGKQKTLWMHRFIMNTPPEMDCDHADRDGLNNQKHNLRNCTRSQNNANQKAISKSGYRGVYQRKEKYSCKFRAEIRVNKRLVSLGDYNNSKDAAIAYDNAALKYYGEFASLNFK